MKWEIKCGQMWNFSFPTKLLPWNSKICRNKKFYYQWPLLKFDRIVISRRMRLTKKKHLRNIWKFFWFRSNLTSQSRRDRFDTKHLSSAIKLDWWPRWPTYSCSRFVTFPLSRRLWIVSTSADNPCHYLCISVLSRSFLFSRTDQTADFMPISNKQNEF